MLTSFHVDSPYAVSYMFKMSLSYSYSLLSSLIHWPWATILIVWFFIHIYLLYVGFFVHISIYLKKHKKFYVHLFLLYSFSLHTMVFFHSSNIFIFLNIFIDYAITVVPFPLPLHSILPTPSLPHSPPIVHVHGSYL